MIVIFDIDDVLMPWAEKVHEACMAAGLNPNGHPWTQWHMWEDYGCTQEEWLEVVNELVRPNSIYHEPPYPGAAEAVRRVFWAGHDVHLVTARGFHDHAEQIKAWTVEWKEEFALPGTLTFAQNKGKVAQDIGATHGIDDRDQNWWDLVNADVDAYMLNQPHNQSSPVPSDRRVRSVGEFVDKILEEA